MQLNGKRVGWVALWTALALSTVLTAYKWSEASVLRQLEDNDSHEVRQLSASPSFLVKRTAVRALQGEDVHASLNALYVLVNGGVPYKEGLRYTRMVSEAHNLYASVARYTFLDALLDADEAPVETYLESLSEKERTAVFSLMTNEEFRRLAGQVSPDVLQRYALDVLRFSPADVKRDLVEAGLVQLQPARNEDGELARYVKSDYSLLHSFWRSSPDPKVRGKAHEMLSEEMRLAGVAPANTARLLDKYSSVLYHLRASSSSSPEDADVDKDLVLLLLRAKDKSTKRSILLYFETRKQYVLHDPRDLMFDDSLEVRELAVSYAIHSRRAVRQVDVESLLGYAIGLPRWDDRFASLSRSLAELLSRKG